MHLEMLTGRTTLDDFYGQGGYLESVQHFPGQVAMRLLIAALRTSRSPWSAYGMTHVHELGLRPVDDERTPEFVSILGADQYSYFIKYLMPETRAPWPYAWVQGHATSVEEAATMVLTAMAKSGAWSSSEGLELRA